MFNFFKNVSDKEIANDIAVLKKEVTTLYEKSVSLIAFFQNEISNLEKIIEMTQNNTNLLFAENSCLKNALKNISTKSSPHPHAEFIREWVKNTNRIVEGRSKFDAKWTEWRIEINPTWCATEYRFTD